MHDDDTEIGIDDLDETGFNDLDYTDFDYLDDTKFNNLDNRRFGGLDMGEITQCQTFTQVASCAIGGAVDRLERRRKSLRAKLEREQFERQQRVDNSFTTTFRNLFRAS